MWRSACRDLYVGSSCKSLTMGKGLLYVLAVIFTIVNMTDVITASFALEGESNPIYLLTGSLWYVFALKIFAVIFLWILIIYNNYKTRFNYFILVAIVTYGIFSFSLGTYSNIMGMMNRSVIEYAATLNTTAKIQAYSTTIFWLILIPMLCTAISFIVYDKTRRYVGIKQSDDA